MKKIGKKAISILLVATFLLSIIPAITVSAITAVTHTPGSGVYGDEVTVTGSGVTAGATVNVYWDLVMAWNGSMGLIKTGTAAPAGTFSITFDVPEAKKW